MEMNSRDPQLSTRITGQLISPHYQNRNSLSNNVQDYHLDQDYVNSQRNKRRMLPSILSKCCSSLSPLLYGLLLGILTAGLILAIIITLWLTSTNSTTSITTAMMTTTTTTTTTTIVATTTITTVTTRATTRTSTVTTTTTTSTTTAPICTASPNTWFEASASMPPQCSNYTINTDTTRNIAFYNSNISSLCDNAPPFGNRPVWFRFLPPAGTAISNHSAPNGYCGTSAPGWYAGQYPSTLYTTATSIACFVIGTNLCWQCNLMSVTNCNTFFVFGLPKSITCNVRYCTM